MKSLKLVFLFPWVVLIATVGCKTILPPSDMLTGIPPTKKSIEASVDWIYTFPSDTRVDSALIHNGIAYYNLWTETAEAKPLGIQAYDLRNQKVRWTISLATYSYLVLGGERLFLISSLADLERKVTAVNIENGKTIWTTPIPSEGYDYEMAYGDNKLFSGNGNTIYCLSASSGELLWQKDLASDLNINIAWFGNTLVYSDYSALSFYGGNLYVRTSNSFDSRTFIEGQYMVMDSQNGAEKWKKAFKIPKPAESPPFAVASQPAFEGESMFFIDWTGRGYLMNTIRGELAWSTTTSYPASIPILKEHQVCFATTRSEIVCLDVESGHEIWNTSFDGLRLTSPLQMLEDDILVVADNYKTQHGELLQIDLRTGKEKQRLEMSMSDKCYSCVSAVNVDRGVLYLVLRHSIVAINLTP